jgi:hypothetical protein
MVNWWCACQVAFDLLLLYQSYQFTNPPILPIYQSTNLPTYQPTNLPTYQPTNLPTYQPTNQSTNLPTYQPTNLPTYQPTNLPIYQSPILPTYQSTNLPIYQPTNLPTYQGAAICLRLAAEGAHVVVADLNSDGAQQVAADIAAQTDRRSLAVRVNIADETDVAAAVQRTVAELWPPGRRGGQCGILIAEPICEADAEKWRAVMNVNLFGNFLTFKHACRIMKAAAERVHHPDQLQERQEGQRGQLGLRRQQVRRHRPGAERRAGDGQARRACNAICPGNLLDSPLWTDPAPRAVVQYLRAGKVPGASQSRTR